MGKSNLLDVFDDVDDGKKEEKKKEESPEESEEQPPKPEKTPPTPPPKTDDSEFDFTPAEISNQHTITIYGLKGAGKTTLALSLPGTHFALTFDNKTQSVASEAEKPERIQVHDGVKYYDKTSPENWLDSSEYSWKYINALLDRIKLDNPDDEKEGRIFERPDWIMVDGGEIVHTMLEMVMRARNNLMTFQGISNRNIWKERRMYIETLLHRCQKIAKRGVVWTSYINKDEIKEEGDYVSIQDVPKWIDAVLYETDVLIKVGRKTGKAGQEFYAIVESSKWKAIPETGKVNVTDRGFEPLIKDKSLFNK